MSDNQLMFFKKGENKFVNLNVGGYLFTTSITTLTKYDSMLKLMFSGELEILMDSHGYVLIDRSGEHFRKILNYLRNGTVILPNSDYQIEELLEESKYYNISGLTNICENALGTTRLLENQVYSIDHLKADYLKDTQNKYFSMKWSLYIDSMLQQFIRKSSKSLIIFYLNKNSIKNESENINKLRKLTKLFKDLSEEHGKFITFIKYDIRNNNDVKYNYDICTWKFYKLGKEFNKIKLARDGYMKHHVLNASRKSDLIYYNVNIIEPDKQQIFEYILSLLKPFLSLNE